MGSLSRNKGRAGEQECARLLRDNLGIDVTRNWAEQAAHGGCDLVGINGWAIEVKRAKSYDNKWWLQTVEQANAVSANPALLYRLDRRQWTAELRGGDVISELADETDTITMSLNAFCTIVRERTSDENMNYGGTD